jgi:integrase
VESEPPKLLDRVRTAIRVRHYSRRTEQAYVYWIRRFIVFHGRIHPSEMGAAEIAAFVSWLAVRQQVSASTQNQALSALLFLYRHVLGKDVGSIDAPRAYAPVHVPVVLSRDEVGQVLARLHGVLWLIVALIYGAGLRLQECLELRVKDIDFDRHEITVRRGKGQKDRRTMLPGAVVDRLRAHLGEVKRQHDRDLAAGLGRVMLPFALDRKIHARRTSGRGNLCFPRAGFVEMPGTGRHPGITCTSRWSSVPWRRRRGRRGWPSAWGATRFGIRLRRTCSRTGMTSAPCRSCSGMPT